jgi:hypothetical protein
MGRGLENARPARFPPISINANSRLTKQRETVMIKNRGKIMTGLN